MNIVGLVFSVLYGIHLEIDDDSIDQSKLGTCSSTFLLRSYTQQMIG